MMTKLLEVSRSGYYDWLLKHLRPLDDDWLLLKEQVLMLWEKSKHRHGVRHICI